MANTLGHTIAAINVANDANKRAKNLVVGGLATDVKIAGRWGIVSGQGDEHQAGWQGDRARLAGP